MPCGWEGNRRSGQASQSLSLLRVRGIREGVPTLLNTRSIAHSSPLLCYASVGHPSRCWVLGRALFATIRVTEISEKMFRHGCLGQTRSLYTNWTALESRSRLFSLEISPNCSSVQFCQFSSCDANTLKFMIDWFIDWLTDWLTDWLIDWLIDLAYWFIHWFINSFTDWWLQGVV